MTKRICGDRIEYDERLMICRRSVGHDGDHSYSTFRAKRRRKPPEELDCTEIVERVYISGNSLVVRFDLAGLKEVLL